MLPFPPLDSLIGKLHIGYLDTSRDGDDDDDDESESDGDREGSSYLPPI
jgi:hypothetical protein